MTVHKSWPTLALSLWLALFSENGGAATQRVEVAEGAVVYSQPDFQSEKLETLKSGTIVRIKTEKRVGLKGIGVFFRAKTPTGILGFIVDGDITGPARSTPALVRPAPPAPAPPTANAAAPLATPAAPPAAATGRLREAFAGLAIGMQDFAAPVRGKTYSASQLFLGARWITAPLWRSMVGELGGNLAPQAPRFLGRTGAFGQTKGYVASLHFLPLFKVVETGTFFTLVGAGPKLSLLSFSTNFNEGPNETQDFRAGGLAQVSLGFFVYGQQLRLDLNYTLDAAPYPGAFLSFLMKL